jgi:hypothetical protein
MILKTPNLKGQHSSMPIPHRSLADLLTDDSTPLGQLVRQAHYIEDLNQFLQQTLAPEFTQPCQVGDYIKGHLTLLVFSAASATRLRFQIPDLREKLRKQPHWYALKSIQVKVKPQWRSSLTTVAHPAPLATSYPKSPKSVLSDEIAQQFAVLAQNLAQTPANARLKQTLLRLTENKPAQADK